MRLYLKISFVDTFFRCTDDDEQNGFGGEATGAKLDGGERQSRGNRSGFPRFMLVRGSEGREGDSFLSLLSRRLSQFCSELWATVFAKAGRTADTVAEVGRAPCMWARGLHPHAPSREPLGWCVTGARVRFDGGRRVASRLAPRAFEYVRHDSCLQIVDRLMSLHFRS